MAEIVLPRSAGEYTDGVLRLEVEGSTVRALLRALDARFPGLGTRLEEEMAVSIDGEILNDPWFESVGPGSEVHFLPPVRGG